MSLVDRSPSAPQLAPELYGSRRRDAHATRVHAAHVRDGVRSTFVVPGDWPEDTHQWHADGMSTYSTKDDNAVEFYTDGASTYAAMVEALGTATGAGHFVILVGWTCYDDFPLTSASDDRAGALAGQSLREILISRATEGVVVRVLLWNNWFTLGPARVPGSDSTAGSVMPAMRATWMALDRAAGDLRCAIDDGTRLRGSHHQKLLIVAGAEGLIAFYGGVDVNPDRVGSGRMHDVHARVRGRAAEDLLALAKLRWAHRVDPDGPDVFGEVADLVHGAPTPIEDLRATAEDAGTTRVKIVQTVGNPAIARLSSEYTDLWPSIAHALRRARHFVYLEDQYFWSLDAARELADALEHIAHLTILLPHGEAASSHAAETWAEQATTDLVSAADLRHAALSALFREAGGHRHKIGVYQRNVAPEYIHAKTWIIDDELAIVGSANCNRRGYGHDSEVAGVSLDRIHAPWHRLEFTGAHALRMRLWRAHLGIEGARLVDGVGAAAYWRAPPRSAQIGDYMVPEADTEVPIATWAARHSGAPFPDSAFIDPAA